MRLLMLLSFLGAALVPGTALAQAPGTGIEGTAHDFIDEAAADGNTVGLCTFCHTPHRAYSTRLLWNHTLSAETYSWSDVDQTTGGTDLPTFDASWQGVSKNCLSCHDGTVAIGDVAWFEETLNPELSDHQHSDPLDPAKITAGNTNDPATPVDDGDLAGNHPVAVPFPLNDAPNTYNGITNGALAAASGWDPDPESQGIRLFNDDGTGQVTAGSVAGQTGIECSSCHDPHNGGQVLDDFFLRGELTGTGNGDDYICQMCHNK